MDHSAASSRLMPERGQPADQDDRRHRPRASTKYTGERMLKKPLNTATGGHFFALSEPLKYPEARAPGRFKVE